MYDFGLVVGSDAELPFLTLGALGLILVMAAIYKGMVVRLLDMSPFKPDSDASE